MEKTFCKLRPKTTWLNHVDKRGFIHTCVPLVPQLPVHNVGGECRGEAERVEADLRGCAERQAGHDGEEGQIHPQACRRQRRGNEFSFNKCKDNYTFTTLVLFQLVW